uniref:Uncharacterized protein n=1 Tax=Eutreptiella gymnastica TaxID=73025 RepID=A0A7S4C8L0_9EUGL
MKDLDHKPVEGGFHCPPQRLFVETTFCGFKLGNTRPRGVCFVSVNCVCQPLMSFENFERCDKEKQEQAQAKVETWWGLTCCPGDSLVAVTTACRGTPANLCCTDAACNSSVLALQMHTTAEQCPHLVQEKKMPFTIAHSALLEQGVNNWLQHQDRDT